jgi:hypothetical protein
MNVNRMPTGNGPCHAPTSSTELKARIVLQGAAGSGKSYSALLLAYGLCENYKHVAVIETCHRAIAHYQFFGEFQTVHIQAPYHSEKFLDALEQCAASGAEVIILDTLSSEWNGPGGTHEQLTNGEDVLHYHEALLDAIQQCPAHIIATLQTTEMYDVVTTKGKRGVEKLGLAPLQQDGIHYHFDTVLALDSYHRAKCLKDCTSFFEEHSGKLITEDLAALFPKWLNKGVSPLHSLGEAVQQSTHSRISSFLNQ